MKGINFHQNKLAQSKEAYARQLVSNNISEPILKSDLYLPYTETSSTTVRYPYLF